MVRRRFFLCFALTGWLLAIAWRDLKSYLAIGIIALATARKRYEGVNPDALERFHPSTTPSDNPHWAENFYFWVHDADASFCATIRLSFKANGSDTIPWFTLRMNDTEFELPNDFHPKPTEFDRIEAVARDGAGTLSFEVVVPLKTWRVRYEGRLVTSSLEDSVSEIEHRCVADFTLQLDTNVFIFDRDWSVSSVGRSLASVPWNTRAFWSNLRSQRQERYTSAGRVSAGNIAIVSSKRGAVVERRSRSLKGLYGSRDHNFGVRDWSFLWRYVWWPPLHFDSPLSLGAFGTFTHLTGTLVTYGSTFENLSIGGILGKESNASLPISNATSMRTFAREWYDGAGADGCDSASPYGAIRAPSSFALTVSIEVPTENVPARCVLDVRIDRGAAYDMWEHAFYFNNDNFEVHEALATWDIHVRGPGAGSHIHCGSDHTTALGMFEFGANLGCRSSTRVLR
eukprot:g3296.t1